MRKKVISLCFIFLLSVSAVYSVHSGSSFKRVLLISSYNPSFPTFKDQIDGLRSVFDIEDVILDIEFMDSKRFNDPEHLKNFKDNLLYKLKLIQDYDVIISADDNALGFCLENRAEMFNDIPIIFFGVNDIDKALSLNQDPLITGLIEAVSMRDTIELMTELIPEAVQITAITDSTTSGQADLRSFYQLEDQFPDYIFTDLSLGEYSWHEFFDKLSGIDGNTAVLLLSAYTDRNFESKLFYESLELISTYLKKPLFHLWYHGVGEGVLGGKLISAYDQAASAAEIALKVLDGEDISTIPIEEASDNFYIFDYNQLIKHSIKRNQLPEGSRIVNQPENFYTENKTLVWLAGTVFLFLSMLLLITVLNLLYRRKIEFALRESELKYKALFYENKSVMMLLDPSSGLIVGANDSALNYYGYSVDDIRTKSIYEISFNSKNEIDESIKKLLDGKQEIFSTKHRLADGKLRDVEIYSGPILLKEHVLVYAIIHDVTEKNIYHRNMEAARLQAESALRVKNDFLANISHELRTPLNGIVGMLDLIKSADYSADEQQWYKLAVISSENLTAIIEDLLWYTQFEAGKLSIQKQFISLKEIVNLSRGMYEDKIYRKGLRLEINESFQSGYFYCDATRLSQIINNLLSNSLKYSNDGIIRLELNERDTDLEIIVSDDGIGMTADSIETIFEPFRQLEDTFTKRYQGMGLGLAIVKNIVECLQGEISVTSNVGTGSVFRVLIPGEFKTAV